MERKMTWKEMPIGGVIPKGGTALKNKTGSWRAFRPVWDEKRCIDCMQCVVYCPDMSIPAKAGKRLETDFDYCKGCGICANVCPVKCIEMREEEKFE